MNAIKSRGARIAAVAAAVLAVAVPAALAGLQVYEGKVRGDDRSSVKLKVEREAGERLIRRFVAKDFAISCEGGVEATLSRARISGKAPVDDEDRFRIEGEEGELHFKVKGKLKGRKRARGNFVYRGMTAVDEEELRCESEKLRWKARR